MQLLAYAEEWRTGGASPANVQSSLQAGALRAIRCRSLRRGGRAPAALRQLKPRLLPSAPPFHPPLRPFVEIPSRETSIPPAPIVLAPTIGPHFQQSISTSAGSAVLAVAVYIPAECRFRRSGSRLVQRRGGRGPHPGRQARTHRQPCASKLLRGRGHRSSFRRSASRRSAPRFHRSPRDTRHRNQLPRPVPSCPSRSPICCSCP